MTNPTPPTPPEMPEPDYIRTCPYDDFDIHGYEYFDDGDGNPIERYAEQLQTENARLRKALERTEHDLRRYDPSCDECNGIRPRPDKMRERITQALHSSPVAGGKDEDE